MAKINLNAYKNPSVLDVIRDEATSYKYTEECNTYKATQEEINTIFNQYIKQ